jgi:hypothetical protein
MRFGLLTSLIIASLFLVQPAMAGAKPALTPDVGGGVLGISLAMGVVYVIRRSRKRS